MGGSHNEFESLYEEADSYFKRNTFSIYSFNSYNNYINPLNSGYPLPEISSNAIENYINRSFNNSLKSMKELSEKSDNSFEEIDKEISELIKKKKNIVQKIYTIMEMMQKR